MIDVELEVKTLPVSEPIFTSNKYVRYTNDCAFEVFAAPSNSTDLTLAVPIFVLVIVDVVEVLIKLLATQCKSTVCKLLIGNVP